MRLSEYMRIMCPDVTTKNRRCWMPLELELQVSVWGPNLDALKEQKNVLNPGVISPNCLLSLLGSLF